MTEVLVGSNLAVLVAAALCGAAGSDVVVLTDGQPLGGHFRGLTVEGHDFDIGRVMIERAEPGMVTTLAHRPDTHTNWTAHAPAVDEVLEQHVDLRRTSTPESFVAGRRWPDHLTANRLDVLRAGAYEPPPALARDDPRHAATKVASATYDTLTYADAALANHGSAIHERLFEPFVRKLMGVGSHAFLARYHRFAWVPLYWPETLTAVGQGRSTPMAEYPFWTTATGFTGELVRGLERRLERSPRVRVERAPLAGLTRRGGEWTVTSRDGRSWTSRHPVLGTSPGRAASLVGAPVPARPAGASVVVVLCLVRSSAIRAPLSCLYVVDEEFAAYRLTDQDALAGLDPAWHRVVVEGGAAAAAGSPEQSAARLLQELRTHLGVEREDDVRVLKTLVAAEAKPIPSAAMMADAAVARADLQDAVPEATLTGSLIGHDAAALNEQLVQGFLAARLS